MKLYKSYFSKNSKLIKLAAYTAVFTIQMMKGKLVTLQLGQKVDVQKSPMLY